MLPQSVQPDTFVNTDAPPVYSKTSLPSYPEPSHHVNDDRPVRSLRGTLHRGVAQATSPTTTRVSPSGSALTPPTAATEGQQPPAAARQKKRIFVRFKTLAGTIGVIGAWILVTAITVLGSFALILTLFCLFAAMGYGTDRSEWPFWPFGR